MQALGSRSRFGLGPGVSGKLVSGSRWYQSIPSLFPSSPQDQAPQAGSCARQKTVLSQTAFLGGLIRPLHRCLIVVSWIKPLLAADRPNSSKLLPPASKKMGF
ncbi:hypothetical protein MPNT_40127 [Candidatus Methylacidithermus pantelleriae]|uniref:Uncharacterized protein n=1 Tax=Candidatus Methylacidithermus pantelleriae TaxID=2744239 RepID=A0A8J2FTA3_9BACT|nr:hypothetical protein MPNT_40127 [Candidatus Methylacidithermus pantelleriae]